MAGRGGAMSKVKSIGSSAKETLMSKIDGNKRFNFSTDSMNSSNLLIKAPVITVIICLIVTGFFLGHSGINDCRDGYEPSWCSDESSMNVNGDLEVYLPQGSDVSQNLYRVEEIWTTNVMIIYVESEDYNITTVRILEEMDRVERGLNTVRDDNGQNDDIIYALSISTVVKEVNSSAGRVISSFGSGIATAIGNEELAESINATLAQNEDFIGNYDIPDEQQRVDQILDEMPQNALDKLVRDVGRDYNNDGIKEAEKAGYWNRAVIIIGVADGIDRDGDGEADSSVAELIQRTQGIITDVARENNWNSDESDCIQDANSTDGERCLNLKMTLTGPVPLTNAVTEESFKLFWKVFPIGGIAVALSLFFFHCDLLQTGRIRFVQGVKVVIISGLPTLCSVFITMGIIGFTNYEVTMTVIIVGPIVLALGVSYGLHITNSYAENKGTPEEKIKKALESTGRAVLLSAITTIIGFISLTFTPMAPIQTVGWCLAMGIVVVYLMTMLMVPNLTMILDLKKPSHPPPKIFTAGVSIPTKWSKITLSVFLIFVLISAGISRTNVEENIDLLKMAPQNVDAVQKLGTYSDEFDGGQPGFLLIETDISADPSLFSDPVLLGDPYSNLEGMEELESKCNQVESTTALSVVFLMKAIAVGINVSGTPINDVIEDLPLPDPIDEPVGEVADILFNNSRSGNVSFWGALDLLDAQETGGIQAQNFLIYVFYNSLSLEMREFFISPDFQSSLIYIDMPFMDVQRTKAATEQIDLYASQDTSGALTSSPLVGVASITIEVNELIVGSQWDSLTFALLFTVITLGLVFRDLRFALLTTIPVGFTVGMQWLVMDSGSVTLSLVTVMIGSILVGVGVDFSIHIANRVKKLGGTLDAIQTSCASTGLSLFEATVVTASGMTCAYLIPIPALKPFITVIIILLVVAALSALLLLPAIYSFLVKTGIPLTGGSTSMIMKISGNLIKDNNEEVQIPIYEAKEAW
ncbi:MAG: MMPL family transporter [Candidatus Thermoplasmatota archaeon]|nr:MMPL family transporter [Candidatus Thermoplasmatota archaeon]